MSTLYNIDLRRIFTALTILVLAQLLLVSPASAATTITVTQSTDQWDSETDCIDTPSDCSFREAISYVNTVTSGDYTIFIPIGMGVQTITIPNASGDEDGNRTGDFDIDFDGDSLTIYGEDISENIISGNSADRVFDVHHSTGEIEFTNIAIQDADSTTIGTGFFASGAGLRVSNNGGGLVMLSRVIFYNNYADYAGGGLYLATGSVQVSDSYFGFNSSANRGGGAIMLSGGAASVSISSTTFESNETIGRGGAIYLESGNVDITNSTFNNNRSHDEASAISAFTISGAITLDISHSTFVEDAADTINLALIASNAFAAASDITVRNSILEISDTDTDVDTVCYTDNGGTITSLGYNLVSDDTCSFLETGDEVDEDLFLNTYGIYGQSYLINDTYGLQAGSPAIDAVPVESCLDANGIALETDTREYTRPESTNCDIGAYEFDQTDPVVTLDPSSVTLECMADSWTAPTASVTDFDSSVSLTSIESTTVEETIVGLYSVVYVSEADYDGNVGHATQSVSVVDTMNPAIEVIGGAVYHEAGTTYTDAGAHTGDACDPDVSVNATSINVNTLGVQTVIYTASDASGNAAEQKTRTVTVQDTISPIITLLGSTSVSITVGEAYTDAGATAIDSFEGDITGDIETISTVNTAVVGTYSVTYNVADSSGNDATAVTRTVIVEAAPVDDGDDDSDNDPGTGDGDGTDDTEDTLGAVTDLEPLSNNRVRVTYEDGSSKTFQLFPNGSAKAKVQLHTNGEVLIAINKKFIRTYDAFTGERLFSKKLFKKAQYKTKLKRYNIYTSDSKDNIMVLAQANQQQKKQFKLRAFVVQGGGKIVVRNKETVTTNQNTKFAKLNTKKNNKNGKKARIIVTRKGKNLQEHKYRVLKKTGNLLQAN